ncbi:CHAT domain-containing protein [Leptolyngbya sp. AN02str]|uniref:CHAT domain-containing protein n=1 Tax=Leptolyngbya sp. AN02str TaxID=3423363 RepID=UPI003D313831
MADEQRMQAYGALIEQLLNCPQGEETNILQSYPDLFDAGLLAVMEQVAVSLEEKGNGNAQWLRGFATRLAEAIGLETSTQQDREVARQFLRETLQLVSEKRGDSQQIYSIWSQQQERFNEELLAVLPGVATQLLQANPESLIFVSAVFGLFGNLIQNFPLGTRWLNLELSIAACEESLQMMTRETMPDLWAESMNNLAIAYYSRIRGDHSQNIEDAIVAYQQVLQVWTRETVPVEWATLMMNLAVAYSNRIQGDRAENLEQAIVGYKLALQVRTREAFPQDWGATQYNLGSAYFKRVRGDRVDNLEQAIKAYKLALQVYTYEAFPKDWADTQYNLGITYSKRIRGDRAENLEQEISAYELALQVRTREAFPEDWARTQNNLAIAYSNRIRGDRANNLEQAIKTYELALQVRTREAFPQDWARTQNNLATAYSERIRGDRAENIEQAIKAYKRALQVYTREMFPEDWAMTQSNLAVAYKERIRGDRASNLEQAIKTCELALQVRTREAFPEDWAATQDNLAIAYSNRIRGDRAENLEQAIKFYELALQVRTREAFPEDWAITQNNLATAYSKRIRGDQTENIEQAIKFYELALQVRTREAFPQDWAITQYNLANAYSDRIRGDRAENLEQAIKFYELALQVYTREAFPQDWAKTQNSLANAYSNRIRGDRAENLEQAIKIHELALQVRTRKAFPQDWAMTQNNLGIAYSQRIRGNRAQNIEKAITAYELALQVSTRESMPEEWAMTQHNLATIYPDRIQGDRAQNIEDAIAACERALQVSTRESMPKEWALSMQSLANAYWQRIRGDRAQNIEDAIAAYEQALQVRTRDDFPEDWAMTQSNLAVAYKDRIQGEHVDNVQRAIAAYEKALEIYTPQDFPKDCQRTAVGLGNLLFKEQAWFKAAKAFTRALRAGELLYQNCILLESKTAELAKTGSLPHFAASALARCGHLKAATLILERGRARELSNILERDRANLEGLKQLNSALYHYYRDLTTQIRNLEAQQREHVTNGATVEENRHLRQSLTPEAHSVNARQLYENLNVAIQQIRQIKGYDDFLKPTNFADICAAAQSDCPLVYITSTGAGSFALIVTPKKVFDLWLDERTWDVVREIFVTGLTIYGEYKLGQIDQPTWLKRIDQDTHQLWQLLMEPLIRNLKAQNFSQAILIPAGLLSFVPLHAAWTDDPATPTGRRYAFDEIHLTYTPNAKSLTTAQAIAQQTPSYYILAIDNPRQDLPNSSREVVAAIASFPQPQVLQHDQATVEAILTALPQCHVLHLSCHGTANLNEPLTSGLLMSDGLLTLRDLLNLKLSGDEGSGIRLAILSACETGLSGIKNADEAISLPTGLLQAGVAGVVASLWAVEDRSTMLLLSKFYELWRTKDQEPSKALRHAQIWLRDSTEAEIAPLLGKRPRNPANRPFSHPYYWAAFSYTGV